MSHVERWVATVACLWQMRLLMRAALVKSPNDKEAVEPAERPAQQQRRVPRLKPKEYSSREAAEAYGHG